MPATARYSLRYQALTDAPNGATLGQNLATDVETVLGPVDDRVTALETATDPPPVSATVSAAQSTASTSYTDLATAGPSVTLTTGTTALVTISTGIYNSGSNVSYAGFAISGATTIAANDAKTVENAAVAGIRAAMTTLVTGLTPGSNTFTMKYRAAAGTASFFEREIIVDPR